MTLNITLDWKCIGLVQDLHKTCTGHAFDLQNFTIFHSFLLLQHDNAHCSEIGNIHAELMDQG